MHPIIIQTISYAVVLVLALIIISFLQRGFFWKYVRVRLSFGRFVLVKIRAVNRDYYSVGSVEEGFLLFKIGKHFKRLVIPDGSYFYRSLGISWCDVDDTTGGIAKLDFSGVAGFDPVKYNNLYLRALYTPKTGEDMLEKIVIAGLIVLGLLIIAVGFFVYNMSNDITAIKGTVATLKAGTVITATGL